MKAVSTISLILDIMVNQSALEFFAGFYQNREYEISHFNSVFLRNLLCDW